MYSGDLNIATKTFKNKLEETNRKEMNRFRLSLSSSSWHNEYKNSSYIYISGLDNRLTEGDVAIVFSQWGEPIDINLIRDKKTGLSKGYCFLCYEDQRSTVLAIDNANEMTLLGKTVRVDHVKEYKPRTENYNFSGSEGGGPGIYGITKDIQNRFKRELDILRSRKLRDNYVTRSRKTRSFSRSASN